MLPPPHPFLALRHPCEFQDLVTLSLGLPHNDLIPVTADTLAVLSSLQLSAAWILILKDPLEPSMCPVPKGTCPNTHSPIPAGLNPTFQTQVSLAPTDTAPHPHPSRMASGHPRTSPFAYGDMAFSTIHSGENRIKTTRTPRGGSQRGWLWDVLRPCG